jgi:hypothetical protein
VLTGAAVVVAVAATGAAVLLSGGEPATAVAQGAPASTAPVREGKLFWTWSVSGKAPGLDRARVQVDITTAGVESALSVPVTALVGRSGGGFAVEAVRGGERRELVAVTVGLFDTAEGRVQVEGDLRAGDRVAVPSL